MELIKTPGRARQKCIAFARKAGVSDKLKAVVFTRPQLIKALGYTPDRKVYGTHRDKCLGRCWTDSGIIWLDLPVSLNTIAHEVMHLVTSISHNSRSFENRTLALSRGLNPACAKPHYFEVSVTTKYRVLELTASAAKKAYWNGYKESTVVKARALKE
jgi:hypothetical protein